MPLFGAVVKRDKQDDRDSTCAVVAYRLKLRGCEGPSLYAVTGVYGRHLKEWLQSLSFIVSLS